MARNMPVLVEAAVEEDPGRRRQAARHALSVARRHALDYQGPAWAQPVVWDTGRQWVPQPPPAHFVLDRDGYVWERRRVIEDGSLPVVDRWTPLCHVPAPPPPSHSRAELTEHHAPPVKWVRLSGPQAPAAERAEGASCW
ncbi:hypothetical protein [Streptomyces syringium]|uniref:hypothetical protein n=1 Tax=Streptomyces syringium TaxID=76729 RepID=UPI0034390D75